MDYWSSISSLRIGVNSRTVREMVAMRKILSRAIVALLAVPAFAAVGIALTPVSATSPQGRRCAPGGKPAHWNSTAESRRRLQSRGQPSA
jgi:hypothetical protein